MAATLNEGIFYQSQKRVRAGRQVLRIPVPGSLIQEMTPAEVKSRCQDGEWIWKLPKRLVGANKVVVAGGSFFFNRLNTSDLGTFEATVQSEYIYSLLLFV